MYSHCTTTSLFASTKKSIARSASQCLSKIQSNKKNGIRGARSTSELSGHGKRFEQQKKLQKAGHYATWTRDITLDRFTEGANPPKKLIGFFFFLGFFNLKFIKIAFNFYPYAWKTLRCWRKCWFHLLRYFVSSKFYFQRNLKLVTTSLLFRLYHATVQLNNW